MTTRHWFELEPDQFLRRFIDSADSEDGFDFKSLYRDAKECLGWLEENEAEENAIAALIDQNKFEEAKNRIEEWQRTKTHGEGGVPWMTRLRTIISFMWDK
jgi:hypothetical protein